MTDKCDEYDFSHKPKPMTDIVDRLRFGLNAGTEDLKDIGPEAADEIERLRDDQRMLLLCEGDRKQMADEIKQLRTMLETCRELRDADVREIEQLRNRHSSMLCSVDLAESAMYEAVAEIKRLRTLLGNPPAHDSGQR